MKKEFVFVPLFALISIFCFDSSVRAQDDRFYSSQLETLVTQLKRRSVDLVDRTSQNLRRNQAANRAEVQEAFLAVQIDASAGLFDRMARDNRRAAELRDAAAVLSDLSRRAPAFSSSSFLWRDIQNSIADINRELGGNSGNNNGGNNGENPGGNNTVIGRAFWRGTVDDRIQITIRDRDLRIETVAGRPYPDGTFSFTSALPNRRVTVEVNKQKGRGTARVVQQPSRENDFAAVIEITDGGSGAREYQLEIFWRRD